MVLAVPAIFFGLDFNINIFFLMQLSKGYHDVERIFACQRHPQLQFSRLPLKAHAEGNLGEISAIRVAI